jgi:hypothetical protein
VKHFATLLTLLACLAFAPGCATTSNQTPAEQQAATVRRVQTGVRLAVQIGATIDLKGKPERRPAYESASAGLNELVAQEKWDAQSFALALASSGNSAFTSGNATLVLTIVPQLIDALNGDRVNLDQVVYLKPAITGAADGLKAALAATK